MIAYNTTTKQPQVMELPNDEESEKQILYAAFVAGVASHPVTSCNLQPDDFYQLRHQHIWRAVMADAKPDMFSVRQWLRNNGLLESIGGDDYLMTLRDASDFGYTVNTQRVAEQLRTYAQRRRIIATAQRMAVQAFDMSLPHGDMLANIETAFVDAVSGDAALSHTVHISDVVSRVADRTERLHADPTAANGVPTGFVDLDKLMRGGAKDGELVIVAARPSVGKSSLLMSIAINASVPTRPTSAKRGAIYTLEMSDESLVVRLQSSLSGIDSSRLSVADLRDDEWCALNNASAKLSDAPLWMNDAPMSIADILADARRMKAIHKVDYVMIDFLGLVSSPGKSDYERASAVAIGAQRIAKELRIPVFLACQLSREAHGVRPELSHLRDSGRIEEAGDVVLTLYRDEQHNPNTEYKNICEVLVRKNRNGPTGAVSLYFDKRLTAFRNLVKERINL